jgi:hypothetical protein
MGSVFFFSFSFLELGRYVILIFIPNKQKNWHKRERKRNKKIRTSLESSPWVVKEGNEKEGNEERK